MFFCFRVTKELQFFFHTCFFNVGFNIDDDVRSAQSFFSLFFYRGFSGAASFCDGAGHDDVHIHCAKLLFSPQRDQREGENECCRRRRCCC